MGGGVDKRVLLAVLERYRVSVALRDGPLSRPEIASHFGLSRATAYRVVARFERFGVVRETDESYELTALGRLAVDRVEDALEAAHRDGDLSGLVGVVAPAAQPVDADVFEAVTVTRSGLEDPFGPDNRLESLLENARAVRALDPSADLLDVLATGARDAVDVVCPRGARGGDGTDADWLGETEDGRPGFMKVHVADGVPFALAVTADRVCVGVYDDTDAHLDVLVDTDDADAVAWGASLFDSYRESAVPLGGALADGRSESELRSQQDGRID